jgi:hypothetical protein
VVAWAQTTKPPSTAKSKLERLRIAVAPLGWDTNFTWLQTRSGMLDKRPALEYLVGIDRYTGPPGATECLKTGRPDQRHPRVEPEMNRQRLRPIVPIQGSGGGQERQEKCACRG